MAFSVPGTRSRGGSTDLMLRQGFTFTQYNQKAVDRICIIGHSKSTGLSDGILRVAFEYSFCTTLRPAEKILQLIKVGPVASGHLYALPRVRKLGTTGPNFNSS